MLCQRGCAVIIRLLYQIQLAVGEIPLYLIQDPLKDLLQIPFGDKYRF